MKPLAVFRRRRSLGPRSRGFALVVALTAIVLITVIVLAFFSKALLNRQISFTSTNQIKSDMLARTALDIVVGEVRQEIIDYSTSPTTGIYQPLSSTNIIPIRSGVSGADTNTGAFTIAKVAAAETKIDPGANGKSFGSTVTLDTKSRNGRTLSRWFTSGPKLGSAALPSWTYLSRSGGVITNLAGGANVITGTNFVTGRFSYTVYNVGGLLDANVAGFPTNALANSRFKSSIAYADLTAVGLTTNQVENLVAWRNPGTASNAVLFDSWATGIPGTNTTAAKTAAGPAQDGYLSTAAGDQAFFSRRDLLRYLDSQGIATNAAANFATFTRAVNAPSWGPSTPAGSSINYAQDANLPASFNRFLPGVPAYDGKMKFYQDDGRSEEIDVTAVDPLVTRRFSLAKLAWIGHNGKNDAAFNTSLSNADRNQAILDCFGLTWDSSKNRWDYDHGNNKTILSLDEVRGKKRAPDFFELLRAGILAGSLGTNPGAPNASADITSAPLPAGVMGNVLEIANKKDRQILQIGANFIDQADRDNYPTAIYQLSNQELSSDDVLYNCVFGVENLPVLSRVAVVDSFWPDHVPAPSATVTGDLKVFLQPELWNPHDSATADPTNYPDTPSKLRFVVYGAASLMMDQNGAARQFGNDPAVMDFGRDPAAANLNRTITFINPPPSSGSPPAFLDKPNANTPKNTEAKGAAFNKPELDYIDYSEPQGPNNRHKTGAIKTQWDVNVEKSPYAGIYLGTLSRTVPPDAVSPTPQQPRQHSVWVVPDLALGGNLTFALEYQDSSGNWLPYSMINRVQVIGVQGWSNSSPWGGGWSSEFGRVDPRTDRFSVSHSRVGAGNNETWNKEHSIRSTLGIVGHSLIQWNDSAGGRGALFAAVPRTTSGFTHGLTTKFFFDAWMQNLPTSDFRYEDLDGVTRPGDGWRGLPTSDTSGDGMPTYQLLTATDRAGLKNPVTGTFTGYLKDTINRRRPYILNRPFRSVGELGYVFRDQPFKTLDLWSKDSADAALLDLFSIAESAEVQAGRLNPSTATPIVLQALMFGATKQANLSTANVTTDEALALSLATASELSGINGPAADSAALAMRLGTPAYDAASGVSGNNSSTNQPFRNKTYGETPIRALSSSADTRTWNLLIDVVAQTGRVAAGAAGLSDFIVEGEKRCWLHIAIDRLTGRVVDSQLEMVYE